MDKRDGKAVIKEFVDDAIYVLSNSKYAIIDIARVEMVKSHLYNYIIFSYNQDNIITNKDDSYLEDTACYTYGLFTVSNYVSDYIKRLEINQQALSVSTFRISKSDSIVLVSSGFKSTVFMPGEDDKLICQSVVYKELNHIALKIYARFIEALRENSLISIDDFMDIEKRKDLGPQEYKFIYYSIIIGNDIFYNAFKTGDNRLLEEKFKVKDILFQDFAFSFKEGIDLESVRKMKNDI